MEPIYTPQTYANDGSVGQSIEQLKSFCRGEISAVESYREVMQATNKEWVRAQLRQNMASHEERVQILRRRIAELAGIAPEDSGPWGMLINAVEGMASAFGEKPALSVLAKGESHGVNDYRADLGNLDPESERLVSSYILPQQVRTRDAVNDVLRALAA